MMKVALSLAHSHKRRVGRSLSPYYSMDFRFFALSLFRCRVIRSLVSRCLHPRLLLLVGERGGLSTSLLQQALVRLAWALRATGTRVKMSSDSPIVKLYVGNVSSRMRTTELEDLFKPFGTVVKIEIKTGYAFVVRCAACHISSTIE